MWGLCCETACLCTRLLNINYCLLASDGSGLSSLIVSWESTLPVNDGSLTGNPTLLDGRDLFFIFGFLACILNLVPSLHKPIIFGRDFLLIITYYVSVEDHNGKDFIVFYPQLYFHVCKAFV